ncbi:MAG: PilX N-terminal domain-containing pilus assembly protein [Burkholderiaceae bacterium]
MERIHPIPTSRQQRGISLFIVIVLVMLSMLLALWGSRTSLFNEMVVGNDADYQRAFEAAQALIQDAEFDIQGERANGSPATPVFQAQQQTHAGPRAAIWFPNENKDVGPLLDSLSAAATKCFKGVCLKRTGEQDFWNDKTTLTAMMNENVGARYGQFTGAQTGSTSNPILAYNDPANNKDKGGWYWIEIMPYDSNAGNTGLITNGSNNLALNLTPSVAYRITAIAHGLKPSTQVVLQSTYVRQKMKN